MTYIQEANASKIKFLLVQLSEMWDLLLVLC